MYNYGWHEATGEEPSKGIGFVELEFKNLEFNIFLENGRAKIPIYTLYASFKNMDYGTMNLTKLIKIKAVDMLDAIEQANKYIHDCFEEV